MYCGPHTELAEGKSKEKSLRIPQLLGVLYTRCCDYPTLTKSPTLTTKYELICSSNLANSLGAQESEVGSMNLRTSEVLELLRSLGDGSSPDR